MAEPTGKSHRRMNELRKPDPEFTGGVTVDKESFESALETPGPIMGVPSRVPWQHRSEHMHCRSCMAYAPKTENVGRCRKNAPTMQGYPVVFPDDDWCMQHKLDETYIEHQKARERENDENLKELMKEKFSNMDSIDR